MSARRGGLGRGLGALIPTGPVTVSADADSAEEPSGDPSGGSSGNPVAPHDGTRIGGAVAHFAEVPTDSIRPNPRQPRQIFEEEALAELVHSLREVGFLQPVVVRPVSPSDGQVGPAYELVMGERRWRAAQLAGFDVVPAIVKDTADDDMLRNALLENLHRQQLNPLEEGAAYAQLLTEFGATHEELARRIGRSRSQVTNTIRLLNLPPAVQRRVAAGVLSAGHARALLALDGADAQERLAHRIVAEGLSVRAVEEIVAVGEDEAPKTRHPKPRHRAPALDDLAAALSDHFETRVKVDLGRSRGKITVEFASVDDLERIVAAMAPNVSITLRHEG